MQSSSPPVSPDEEGVHIERGSHVVGGPWVEDPRPRPGMVDDETHTTDHQKSGSSKHAKHRDDNSPSRLLWVGNISSDTTEADLTEVFGRFGKVDNMSVYPQRSYAFIEFESLEIAKKAKEAMQGKVIKGQALRIEFARPAKPGKHLWIWGVSENLTKEQLEEEFEKYGALEDFKLLRDKNSALAVFKNVEDASGAKAGLNKKHIGGSDLRVDFLRSQPVKRWSASLDEKGKWNGPSETLKITFPPDVRADEAALRRAFILFGEVEHIRTFPDRHYCFVQFRNADEASRAKEGLQGRLLNDSRLQIQFSTNESVSQRGEWCTFSSLHHPDMGIRPSLVGPARSRMSIGSQGRPFLYQHGNRPLMAGGRQGSPQMAGFLNGPYFIGGSPNMAMPLGSAMGFVETGTVLASDILQRDHKRLKVESPCVVSNLPDGDTHMPPGFSGKSCSYQSEPAYLNIEAQPLVQSGTGLHGPSNEAQLRRVETMDGRRAFGVLTKNWKWQGSIAKAGIHICRVLCIPVGKGIDSDLPDVVDCIARTSLDVLSQHFHQAFDFELICFIPNGDAENARFQDFVQYLGGKNRAGVAKLVDGTALFLVPPSEFAEKELKVPIAGHLRLLGLVLRSSQLGCSHQEQPPLLYEPRFDYMGQAAPSEGSRSLASNNLAFAYVGQQTSQYTQQQAHFEKGDLGVRAQNTGAQNVDAGLPNKKSESDKSDRFQATLQLAAALLQRMQNIGASEPTKPQ